MQLTLTEAVTCRPKKEEMVMVGSRPSGHWYMNDVCGWTSHEHRVVLPVGSAV